MRGKKAMEIAVNTLVVIILGMVILGIGFVFVRKVIDTGIEMSNDVDDRLMESMRQTQFADGRQAAILNPQQTVQVGDSAEFLLGFVNKLGGDEDFAIFVEYSRNSPVDYDIINELGTPCIGSNFCPNKYIHYVDQVYTLGNNEEQFMWILIDTEKGSNAWPRGQYLFDVYVCKAHGDYHGYDSNALTNCFNPSYKDHLYTGQKQRLFLTVQ